MKHHVLNTREENLQEEINELKNQIRLLKAEKIISDSRNSFLEKVMNSIPSDLVVFDKYHRYQFINPKAIADKKIREWLINKDDFDYCKLKNKPLSLAKKRRKVFNDVLKHCKEISFEEKMINDEGEEVWIYRTMFPIIINKKVEGVIGYAYIISHIKKMESDLLLAKKEGEASLKAKEAFLANMSHEIRTPMNAILGMSQLLSEVDLSPKHKSFLEGITKSANNLLVIINDILDYSKINSNKLTIENISVNLFDEISNCATLFALKCEEKGILLETNIDKVLSENCVKSDPVRITQVLNNLVSNSVKFTSKGMVGLTAKVIKINKTKLSVRFSVKDTGKGIKKENLKAIFNPFSQGDNTVTRKFGGTGLGLTITKDIVSLMGGVLEVDSEENIGSVFSFELDFEKCQGKNTIPKVSDEQIKLDRHLRVLLVEDNTLNQVYAESVLEKHVNEILIANNGKEAIDIIEDEKPFDIILMDIQMPIMGGLECAKILREKGCITPIVALTANAFKEDKELYLKSGMTSYLSKPYSEEQLVNKIGENILKKYIEESKEVDQSLIRELPDIMYKLFIEEMTKNIALFQKHILENDIISINRLAHKIKSNLKMFDLEDSLPLCLKIEKALSINPAEINLICSSIQEKIDEYKKVFD